MKGLRFFKLALLAILCIVIAACGKDDDTLDVTTTTKEKKLVKIEEDDWRVLTFNYGKDGNLQSIIQEDIDGDELYVYNYNYDWSDNNLKELKSEEIINYTLLNDKVIRDEIKYINSGRVSTTQYTYNTNNRLYNADGFDFLWEGDKLITAKSNKYPKEAFEYSYSGKTCKKGYFPFYPLMSIVGRKLFLAHPELVGFKTKQLPDKLIDTYRSFTPSYYSFTYELDGEGYLKKCIAKEEWTYDYSSETYTKTTIYKFTWE